MIRSTTSLLICLLVSASHGTPTSGCDKGLVLDKTSSFGHIRETVKMMKRGFIGILMHKSRKQFPAHNYINQKWTVSLDSRK